MPSTPKVCASCGIKYEKPERFFRVQGRGYAKRCKGCEQGGGVAAGVLGQILETLRSPVCGRCGAHGAEPQTSQAGVVSFICERCL